MVSLRQQWQQVAARIHRTVLPPVIEAGAMPYYSLFYLVFPLMPALIPDFPRPDWPLTFLAIAAFLPIYFGFYWVRGWRRIGLLLAMALLSAALMPANFFSNSFLIYSNVLSGFLPPLAMLLVIVVTQTIVAGAVVFGELKHSAHLFITINLLSCVIAAVVNRFWIANARKNQALRLSQDEIRRLAQVAERERIGRDLHDLLGHTLSVIALKSELATRLFDRDAEGAQREIADVERIAREALGQVRRAVTGMRAIGLRAEFANARLALASVAVDFDYHADELALHPEIETALALALREAATNVIRHAGARRCHAELKRVDALVILAIRDDGHGGACDSGNGLRGMRERLEAQGGSLEISSSGGEGTTLLIRVPFRAAPEPDTRREPGARPRLAAVR